MQIVARCKDGVRRPMRPSAAEHRRKLQSCPRVIATLQIPEFEQVVGAPAIDKHRDEYLQAARASQRAPDTAVSADAELRAQHTGDSQECVLAEASFGSAMHLEPYLRCGDLGNVGGRGTRPA